MKFLVLACLFVVSALAEPEAEAEADSRYLGTWSRGSRIPGFYGHGAYNGAYSAYTMSPYSAYTTPFSAYRAVPTMMHQTRYFGSVPKTAYNMRFKREAEAEAEAEPEAEAEADAQYYGNYGQFQRRNYNGYNRYTMNPYQYAYNNLPGGYNQNRVYGNINGYNYGYGYNRYNQQGPYRSYYGYRG